MSSATLYPKINAPWKRDERGKFREEWSTPELEFLQNNDWLWRAKIDGCVRGDTQITMADFTRKNVSAVRVGDEIMGADELGNPTVTVVEAVHNNGPTDDWLNVRGRRIRAGQGGSFFSVYCTSDHRFWNPTLGEYVRADDLKEGSTVLSLRSEPDLSPLQKSVLLGTLLGDGSIEHAPPADSWGVAWGHTEEDAEYTHWLLRATGDVGNPNSVYTTTSGYGSTMIRAATQRSSLIRAAFNGFYDYDAKRKCVPEWVKDELDPIALAVWYMDDGSLSHHESQDDRAHFAVNGFTSGECATLQLGLLKLGIHSVLFDNKGPTLRLNRDDAERLFLIIAPYVPPCMQRKLPERYRGGPGWLPPLDRDEYRRTTVELEVESIEDGLRAGQSRTKYDLTTGTHNYFAGGILVHNCNIRVTLTRDDATGGLLFKFDGRTDRAEMPKPLLEKLDEIFHHSVRRVALDECFNYLKSGESIVLYGEGYGAGIQKGGDYGPVDFILFDVTVEGAWLKQSAVEDIAAKLDIKCVPIIGHGNIHDAALMIEQMALGVPSGNVVFGYGWKYHRDLWPDKEPEGIVLAPAYDATLFDRHGHRILSKLKLKDYR